MIEKRLQKVEKVETPTPGNFKSELVLMALSCAIGSGSVVANTKFTDRIPAENVRTFEPTPLPTTGAFAMEIRNNFTTPAESATGTPTLPEADNALGGDPTADALVGTICPEVNGLAGIATATHDNIRKLHDYATVAIENNIYLTAFQKILKACETAIKSASESIALKTPPADTDKQPIKAELNKIVAQNTIHSVLAKAGTTPKDLPTAPPKVLSAAVVAIQEELKTTPKGTPLFAVLTGYKIKINTLLTTLAQNTTPPPPPVDPDALEKAKQKGIELDDKLKASGQEVDKLKAKNKAGMQDIDKLDKDIEDHEKSIKKSKEGIEAINGVQNPQ